MLFFQKTKTMSIYVTHGAKFVTKGVAHQCSQEEPYILVQCDVVGHACLYTISNANTLITSRHNTGLFLISKDEFTLYVQSHQEPMNQTQFIEYIYYIRRYFTVIDTTLCLDGNLSAPALDKVTAEVCDLVNAIKPKSLILFSETLDCREDAQRYLNRQSTALNYQLPEYEISGAVTTRAHLSETIQHERRTPTISPLPQATVNRLDVNDRDLQLLNSGDDDKKNQRLNELQSSASSEEHDTSWWCACFGLFRSTYKIQPVEQSVNTQTLRVNDESLNARHAMS